MYKLVLLVLAVLAVASAQYISPYYGGYYRSAAVGAYPYATTYGSYAYGAYPAYAGAYASPYYYK